MHSFYIHDFITISQQFCGFICHIFHFTTHKMFFIFGRCGLQAGQFSTGTTNLKEPCCWSWSGIVLLKLKSSRWLHICISLSVYCILYSPSGAFTDVQPHAPVHPHTIIHHHHRFWLFNCALRTSFFLCIIVASCICGCTDTSCSQMMVLSPFRNLY